MERLIDKIKNKLVDLETNRIVDLETNRIVDLETNRLVDLETNRLVDLETNSLVDLININNIKNVEINYDPETNKKLFIYKNCGIQVKNDVAFKIVFFKINPQDNNDIEKLFELENIKIKSPNPLVVMYKLNEFWNAKLYNQSELELLKYFCSEFKIHCLIIGA